MATNATGTKQFCIFLFILVCVMAFLSLCSLLLAAPGSRAAYVYAGQSVSDAHAQSLHLSSSGTFQITVFEDLHYGEAEDLDWGPRQDVNSTRVMNAVLDAESSTQLVVLNGDLITGENTFLHNSTHYVDRIVEPLVARGLPWASTYGNHDSDFNLSRVGIFEREKRYTNSLTLDMVNQTNAGVSNYYLPVYGLNTSSPEFLLWFFDSRGGNYFQQTDANGDSVAQPGWVDRSVVDWFSSTNDALFEQYRRHIPSIAFVHIPINAMLAFQDQGVDPHRQPGINDDVPLAAQGESNAQGNSVSGYTYAQQDYPFMKALVGTKGLKAVFSGHDHGDSWCYSWNTTLPGMNLTGNGMDLCFGQHSGYGGYGSWIRGSRQILLTEGRDAIETWVRLEDGSISGSVVLNSTYGRDSYSAVEDVDS